MNILNNRSNKPKKNALVGIVKIGYLKKNKSLRKKFFVLREETANSGPACLEYYNNKKKWENNASPKNVTVLKTCFKIDKHVDSRTQKNLIRIYTSEKFFYLLFDSELERDEWLDLILVLQRSTDEFRTDDFVENPIDNIWYITILRKDLGLNPKLMNMTGFWQSDKKFTLMKYPTKSKKNQDTIDIMLSSIEYSGFFGTYFYIKVGESSLIGHGFIWMDIWDSDVARSVHDFIISKCTSNKNYKRNLKSKSSSFNGLARFFFENKPSRRRTASENKTSSTRSPLGMLSPKQTFHKGRDNVSANSSVSGSGLSFYNSLLSKSTEITDRLSSLRIRKNQQSTILEKKQGDFVSFTPLDRDTLRPTLDRNLNKRNLISSDLIGYRSSSSSQTVSYCDSNSHHGIPISVEDQACAPSRSSFFETTSPPDGYLLMKPSYTFGNHVSSMDIWNNTKQNFIDTPKTYYTLPEDYVPMAPIETFSDYVCMDQGKQRSIESGTPSTDARFSNLHFEKVSAYLSPSEEKEPIIRNTRAYSFGSKSDGFREKIERIANHQSRTRALTVDSHSELPPSRLRRPNHQSGSTSMSQQSGSGDHMEIDFNSNLKYRQHYIATSRALSGQIPVDILLHPSRVSCHLRTLSTSARSITLKKVLEVSNVDPNDDYVEMKPGVGLISSISTNMALENANTPPVREAKNNSILSKKMIEDLNRKLNIN